MMRLIGYELKKIFSRRMLWIAVAVGLALFVNENSAGFVRDRLSGQVQGMRDAYARYEGQVYTDALAARAKADWETYIARHPDEFETHYLNGDDHPSYSLRESGYTRGLYNGYTQIFQIQTLEEQQARRARIEKAVQTGFYENGRAVSKESMDSYIAYLSEDDAPPVVVYCEGYDRFYTAIRFAGTMTLMLIILITVWLFPLERSARMEPVVLTTRRRHSVAIAKMTVALLCGLLAYVLFFGVVALSVILTYGFHGFSAPAGGGVTEGQVFICYLTLSLLAAPALAALTALLSAVIRQPLGALLGGVAAVMTQIIPYRIASSYSNTGFQQSTINIIPFLHMGDSPKISFLQNFFSTSAGKDLWRIFILLPATVLWDGANIVCQNYHSFFEGLLDFTINSVMLGLGISVFITALSLWLAPRLWLRQRRT